jgi:hypothetical protein
MRCRKGRIWCCACRRRIPSRREGHWHLDRRLCPRGCRRSVLGLIDDLFAEGARLCSWWRWVEHQAVGEELVVRALGRVKETRTAQATRGSRGMCQGRRIWCCGAWTFGSRLACIWDTERFVGKCSIAQTPTSKFPEVVTLEPLQSFVQLCMRLY